MDMHEYGWICVPMRGFACICMDMHGYARICVDMRGYASMCFDMRGYAWIRMEMHGDLWIRMDMHGYAWRCMDMHGYALICVDMVWGRRLLGCSQIEIFRRRIYKFRGSTFFWFVVLFHPHRAKTKNPKPPKPVTTRQDICSPV